MVKLLEKIEILANNETKELKINSNEEFQSLYHPDNEILLDSSKRISKPKLVKDPDRGSRFYGFRMTYSDNEAKMIDELRIRYHLSTSGMFRLLLHAIYTSDLEAIPEKF